MIGYISDRSEKKYNTKTHQEPPAPAGDRETPAGAVIVCHTSYSLPITTSIPSYIWNTTHKY